MYIPTHFAAYDAALVRLLAHPSAADLVTATADGLLATPLPLLFDPHTGSHGALLGHLARNNDQWRRPPIGEAMVIVRGPDAYVSPGWYPRKAEHGRVVPTWNYVTAHVYGELVVHDDVAWLDALVRRLTDRHEAGRPALVGRRRSPAVHRRAVARDRRRGAGDQPDRGQGQDEPEPPPADIDGVITGLDARGDHAAAGGLSATLSTGSRPTAIFPIEDAGSTSRAGCTNLGRDYRRAGAGGRPTTVAARRAPRPGGRR